MSGKMKKTVLLLGIIVATLIGTTVVASGSAFAAVAAPASGAVQSTIIQPSAPQATPMPAPPAKSQGGLPFGQPFFGGFNPFIGGFNPFFGGFNPFFGGFNPFFFDEGFID